MLDFVVPSSFQQAQQTQQALEPRGLEYSSLQIINYGAGLFSEKQLKRKTTLKSKIPPDLSHGFLLDQQKKECFQEKALNEKDQKEIG